MHCKSKQEAELFCSLLDRVGRLWDDYEVINGVETYLRYADNSCWDEYKENTVYFFNEGEYGHIDYAKDNHYTILTFLDLMVFCNDKNSKGE